MPTDPVTLPDPLPRHVAVIMDGNGRWAARRRWGRVRGHRAGIEAVRKIVAAAREAGVRYLTLYAFSSENWERPRAEVTALMGMLAKNLAAEVPDLVERGVRLRAIGELDRLPRAAREALAGADAATASCDKLDLILALSYGGRTEIVNAVRAIAREGLAPGEIDEAAIQSRLYAPDVPDPDLVIRTSGEARLSNFLLWQVAYAEFHFTDVLWPDFGREEFFAALADYAGRERRFGRTSRQLGGGGQ